MAKKTRRPEPEKESGYELLWGVHPVLEMLRDNPQGVSEITIHRSKSGPRIQEIIDLARGAQIKLRFDTPRGKDRAGDSDGVGRQGVIARVLPFVLLSLDDLIERLRSVGGTPLLLALDTIQDPHNLGAIIRTALAAGVHGVIITRDRSAPLTGTVAKASAGAVAHLDICRVTNLATSLKRLKKEGIWIFGTVKDGPLTIHRAEFSRPLCLVVGGEGKGIRPLVREQCDYLVTIPMQGGLDSLNSSVAAAVALFEIVRQRVTEDG